MPIVPPLLRRFMHDRRILKLIHGGVNDIAAIRKRGQQDITVQGVVEIAPLCAIWYNEINQPNLHDPNNLPGLEKLTERFLGVTLTEVHVAGREWNDGELDLKMVIYAALDVWGVYEVYRGVLARLYDKYDRDTGDRMVREIVEGELVRRWG
ncbi:hypothetical protein HDV00_009736 [Rhizophlyctis rosea]|nr:hypothetical protein HDV00_009736 [Rhizophlyctis rosea]